VKVLDDKSELLGRLEKLEPPRGRLLTRRSEVTASPQPDQTLTIAQLGKALTVQPGEWNVIKEVGITGFTITLIS